jgi:hypothetical protein
LNDLPSLPIDEVALAVQGYRFVGRDACDDFRLVFLADAPKEFHGFVANPHLAINRLITVDDFFHARFDDLQVILGKRFFAREIVVETVFDGRPDRYLGVRPQLLDSLRERMRRVVSEQFDAGVGVSRDDLDRGVVLDIAREVPQLAVDAHGDGIARKALADAGGDFGAPGGSIELLLGAVG